MLLPVGFGNFAKVVEKKLDFVDKTLFIKEVLDDVGTDTVVITRPRRFGKTLGLSMLHNFLAAKVYGQETKALFDHFKIAQCGQDYLQHQGKYPVVFVSFKDIKGLHYAPVLLKLAKLMSTLYLEHQDLLSSPKLSELQKNNFTKIAAQKANEVELSSALADLIYYLYLHYDVKPWLLIDEYDTPIQEGYIHNYYDEIVNFMRGIFGSVLKDNPYVEKAVITGILRIAKESLFSGLNNVKIYSILNAKYSEYFGFTEIEMDDILKQAKLVDKAQEIKQWYNGYQVGETVIYNPWSIANCIQEHGRIEPYWVNTSHNQLIKDLLKTSPLSFKKEFEKLILGESVDKLIDESLTFKFLNHSPDAVWNLLLMAGYLKPISAYRIYQGTRAELMIPNREVLNLFRQIIEQWLANGDGVMWYNHFIDALLSGNIAVFRESLSKILLHVASYHDMAKEPEAFYQGLLMGFTATLHNEGTYEIKSNHESGLGRFDLMLIPKDIHKLGIILEFKVAARNELLEAAADDALKQIDEKKYVSTLQQRGHKQALKIGIGFRGKECVVKSATDSLN